MNENNNENEYSRTPFPGHLYNTDNPMIEKLGSVVLVSHDILRLTVLTFIYNFALNDIFQSFKYVMNKGQTNKSRKE